MKLFRRTVPDTVLLSRGAVHRFRLISIAPMESRTFQLVKGDSVLQWRAVAKDGADLPPARVQWQRATVSTHAGETYDFEVMLDRPDTVALRIVGGHTTTRRLAAIARGERIPRLAVDVPLLVR